MSSQSELPWLSPSGLLLAALWFLRDTLLLAFFAVVLAVGISIPSGWLQRLGLPRGPANVLSVLFVGTVALVLLLWLLPAIAVELGQLLRGLPRALENAASAYNGLREGNERLGQLLPPAQPAGSSLSEEEFRRLVDEVVSTGLPILISGGGLVVSVVSNLVLVVFIAILSLVDPTAYVTASLYLVPKTYHPRLVALWGELYLTLRTWLSALFTSITITVLLVWVILGLLGMPNVLVVAVFAGFATFVPNIGAFLPLIPITIFTLADDPAKLLIMVPAYLAIQSVESNVLSPLIVKRQLSIPGGGDVRVPNRLRAHFWYLGHPARRAPFGRHRHAGARTLQPRRAWFGGRHHSFFGQAEVAARAAHLYQRRQRSRKSAAGRTDRATTSKQTKAEEHQA